MNKFKILISIDYEPFRSPNRMGLVTLKKDEYERDIIEPTYKLLNILEKYNAKLTVFLETAFLLKVRKYKPQVYDSILLQMQEIISNGHDIQMHFHPEWIDINLNNQGWSDYNKDYEYMNGVPLEKVRKNLANGKKLIEDICIPLNSNYKLLGFRAGGYRIQPFNHSYKLLKEIGIVASSDVHRANGDLYYCSSTDIDTPVSRKNAEFIQVPILGTKERYYRRWCFDKDNGSDYIFTSGILNTQASGNHPLTMIGHPKTIYNYEQIDESIKKLFDRENVKFSILQEVIEASMPANCRKKKSSFSNRNF